MPEYDEFVTAHQHRLLGLAHALTGNPHDAWDLTQETLARVVEKWRRIHGDPGAYARTVMVRLNIDRVRRLRRERPTSEPPDTAVAAVVVGEVDGWLVAALATLTPQQRTALALRYVEDLDTRQVAARMGCSEGTARSHLSRGTDRLKDHARGREQELNR
ncbi:SigE family RNA polymerase sigma factor [Nocardioides sp.]|uniref:SigE family RNA polymerase sigma factor n=1 Tax=Nocardioides sp. TaxID=35761 RepID=UPI00272697DA|nr:SigE family RNA polymerase sigma factor [Nocardioides sp.]MDO9457672.1 SigE family RNA polymerase sigma factor [Nocardioides sp.]